MFSKHLHLCFFKLKYPTIFSHHNQTPSSSTPHSTMFHYNTTFTLHTPSSLCDPMISSAHSTSKSTDDYFSSSSDSDSIDPPPLPPPDLASVIASQRFFFSSPGTSNSIIESPDTRPCNKALVPISGGGVRVPTYSLNPYVDFLHSMHEMIHSRQVLVDVRKDWDYLHELLLCYLALNPAHTHKYIVRAFTDLVVELLSSSPTKPPPSTVVETAHSKKQKNRRQRSFSGRAIGVRCKKYLF